MITNEKFLALNNKDILTLTFDDATAKGKTSNIQPISKARYSKKYDLHKITFKNLANPNGCRFSAYLRKDNKIYFGYGDMAISIKKIELQ
jgi:hypothetical protein